MAKTSPPIPHIAGTVTVSTAATAKAASNALPPSVSTRKPVDAASGDVEATIAPFVKTDALLTYGVFISFPPDASYLGG